MPNVPDRLSVTIVDGTIVLSGEVDAQTSSLVDAALSDCSDGSPELDLSAVTFMDSSGLRVLIAQQERLKADSQTLRIVDASQSVRRLFELTSLTDAFPIADA